MRDASSNKKKTGRSFGVKGIAIQDFTKQFETIKEINSAATVTKPRKSRKERGSQNIAQTEIKEKVTCVTD